MKNKRYILSACTTTVSLLGPDPSAAQQDLVQVKTRIVPNSIGGPSMPGALSSDTVHGKHYLSELSLTYLEREGAGTRR